MSTGIRKVKTSDLELKDRLVSIQRVTKVTKGGLQNAASIAAMILTTEALITDIPEEEKAPPMPPGGGMDF